LNCERMPAHCTVPAGLGIVTGRTHTACCRLGWGISVCETWCVSSNEILVD
jgi:hypothetical protein